MLAAGEVKGISPKCREYFNPLTKGKVTVCDGEPKKPEESSKFEGKPEISEPIPPTDPNFQVTDYQYGIYCQAMNWLNERKSLVEVGSAYDALFDGVEKVNEHSFDAFAKSVGLPNTFWLATTSTYAHSAGRNLLGVAGGKLADPFSKVGNWQAVKGAGRALTVDAWGKSTYFQLAASAHLMFAGVFRGPDEMIDKFGGKQLTGGNRKAAYWGLAGAEVAGAFWFLDQGYSTMLTGEKLASGAPVRISRLSRLKWAGLWSVYSAYFYAHVDQRENLRRQGKDPGVADNPLNWSWDAYNPNRFVSDWSANELGAAPFWALGPKMARSLTDKVFVKLGYFKETEYTNADGKKLAVKEANFYQERLPFSTAEKAALLTPQEGTFLAARTLRQDIFGIKLTRLLERFWIRSKFVGRVGFTSIKTPSRWFYVLLQTALNVLISSMPLSRINQMARSITEDDKSRKPVTSTDACEVASSSTIRGVSNRALISNLLNNLVLGPARWMGANVSIYGFYAPGMALNVYPYNSCNEIPSSFHQLALLHLERYREATSEETKIREKTLFKMFFGLTNPEDQKKDIAKYTHQSYPEDVRTLFALKSAGLMPSNDLPTEQEVAQAIQEIGIPQLATMSKEEIVGTILSLSDEELAEGAMLSQQPAGKSPLFDARSDDPWLADPSKG